MKALIIYHSVHHSNTEMVARAIAKVLGAELATLREVKVFELHKYDLIGFGSDIYFAKYHKELLNFINKLPVLQKKTFIFSTSKEGQEKKYLRIIREKLQNLQCEVIGEFSCKGFDTSGPWRILGGANKGHPDSQDLVNARMFANSLLEEMKQVVAKKTVE